MKEIKFEMHEDMYNRLQQLKQLSESKNIGVVIARALAIYEHILKCQVDDGTVYVEFPNGSKIELNIK